MVINCEYLQSKFAIKISNQRYHFNFTGHENIVGLLIEKGADIDAINARSDTALILALEKGIYLKDADESNQGK